MQEFIVGVLSTILLSQISLKAVAQGQEVNYPPILSIREPREDQAFDRNTLIPYSIQVTDREDGNSAYEEIEGREVLLIVHYLEDGKADRDVYLANLKQKLQPLFLMSHSTCLNCHAGRDKLIGPSFDLIAKTYHRVDTAREYLANKIQKGGTGIWGEEIMPPHPELSQKEAERIAEWILNQAENSLQFFVGLEGALKIPDLSTISDTGVLVLTAAYRDHGSTSSHSNQKQGFHSIELRIRH